MSGPVFINHFSLACALGATADSAALAMLSPTPPVLSEQVGLIDGRSTVVGRLPADLKLIEGTTRTNGLMAHLVDQLRAPIDALIGRYGPSRIAFLTGTSTSGIEEATQHLARQIQTGAFADDFRFARQELGDTSVFGAARGGVTGPTYTVSTACTSGSKAMAAGARMIATGLVDAAIVGGADTLADLTLNGFNALESVSERACNPFSAHRDGINIGEGGALFILSREPGPFRLEGWGESSDAHHASAPDPSGAGAEIAVQAALAASGVVAGAVGFVHAHGTATRLNDQMEAGLISRLFGAETPCCSSKPMTGHTLGAAGSVQAALSLLSMERGVFPPHLYDGDYDPYLPRVRLSVPGERPARPIDHLLSLSFAFGGNNIALMLGRG